MARKNVHPFPQGKIDVHVRWIYNIYCTKHKGIGRITLFSNVSLVPSLGETHRGHSRMTFRSWVRTLVVANRQFSDPVIFDKLGCKVFV